MKEFLQTITWFNPKIIESVVQGVSVFMTKKTVAKMLDLPKIGINKLPTKPTKEKEREKEVAIYQQVIPPKTFINRGGKVGKEGCLVKDFANDDYHHLLFVECK
jgi:hypothetical protein